MRISKYLKGMLILTLAVSVGGISVEAKPKKEPKQKKEKITDPRLLTIVKMSKPVKEEQLVKKNVKLATVHRAVQGFDVTDNGATFWYSQPGNIGKQQPGLTKVQENYIMRGSAKERMLLEYFGGANSLAVEQAADGDYFWIGSNGTKFHGAYQPTYTFSRIKFEAGKQVNKCCDGETYYVGGERYCYPAVNAEQDILAVATQKQGVVTIRVYKLSEARSLPNTEVTLPTIKWKGEVIGEEEETVTRTVACKDLTKLDPLGQFTLAKPSKDGGNPQKDVNFYSFRGFDVDKDYVYFVEGNHNKGDMKNGPSNAYVTVFDHSGSVVLPRRRIHVIGDQYMLDNWGIINTGYADIGGIKVKGNTAYIIFAANNKAGKNKGFRATVVKYE